MTRCCRPLPLPWHTAERLTLDASTFPSSLRWDHAPPRGSPEANPDEPQFHRGLAVDC
jgi:hypothetical protein